MSIVTDTVLKTYLETGDTPSQSEFIDLIDSKFSKYHGLGSELSITDDEAIIIPAKGLLIRVVAWSSSETTIKIGDTVGGEEYLSEKTLQAGNVPRVFDLDPVFSVAGKTIQVELNGGAGGSATIKYYIQ